MNIHQAPLCDEIFKIIGDDFIFLSTSPSIDDSNKKIIKRNYVVLSTNLNSEDLEKLFRTADCIVAGHCSDLRLIKFFTDDKLIIHNGEHLFKKFKDPISFLKCIKNAIIFKRKYKFTKPYVLANSHYLKKDLDLILFKYEKVFNFGYFPPTNKSYKLAVDSTKKNNIIFIGRYIKWKKPGSLIPCLEYINENNNCYTLEFYGDGPYKEQLIRRVKASRFRSKISVNHALDHEEVLKHFLNSEIFIFSSNHEEGWGSVLNEALSCGCIVFANKNAGSTLSLIKDYENGFLYNNSRELKQKIKYYLSLSKEKKIEIRKKAFETISKVWNEKVAAERFVSFLKNYKTWNGNEYKSGPMSVAQ